jgi:hypothetical protein
MVIFGLNLPTSRGLASVKGIWLAGCIDFKTELPSTKLMVAENPIAKPLLN